MRTIQILKRTLLTFLVLVAFNLSASAYDFIVDGIAYTITSDSTVEVCNNNSDMWGNILANIYEDIQNLIIPKQVDFENNCYTVNGIKDRAFENTQSLISIIIPASVQYIGYDAFAGCSTLSVVNLPSGITTIKPRSFSGCSSLKSIIIPESVESIGEDAFRGCGITSISIPDGVTYIGYRAFEDCNNLSSISIPRGITSLEGGVFSGCSSLSSIYIPEYIDNISGNVFSYCTNLTSIVVDPKNKRYDSRNNCNAIIETSSNALIVGCVDCVIPDDVTTLGAGAFLGCDKLLSIQIPNSVKKIDGEVFSGCSNLIQINIPESVSSIGGYAFSGCRSLEYAEIPEGVTAIHDGTFYYSGIKHVKIPSSVISIGVSAFSYSNLTSIIIPEGVKSIDEWAFSECDSLVSISIPRSVKNIDSDRSFYNCFYIDTLSWFSSLNPNSILRFCRDNLKYLVIGGDAHDFDFSNCKQLTEVYFKEGINKVHGFDYCSSLEKVDMPEGVEIIDDWTFYNCSSLASISIPQSTRIIGKYAFYDCPLLDYLVIPNNVDSIGSYALYNIDCYFESIIPAKLESEFLLGDYGVAIVSSEAFDYYRQANYWHDMTAKIVRADQSKRIVTSTASPSSSGLHIAVGEDNLNSVMDLTINGSINGKDLLVIRNKMKNLRYLDLSEVSIVANDDMFDYYQGGAIMVDNELGANAFKDMNIRSVVLPKNLVAINDNAFNNCGRLESVYIYDVVKNINPGAFYGCNKLNDLHMSANVKLIGERAFFNCAIDTLIFGDSLKTIGYEAFHGNGNLRIISLGDGIETLGPGAFSGCTSLEYVDFGNHLVDINHGAFDGCYNLKTVFIPNSVTRIGYEAFRRCNSIDTLFIGHKVEYIEERAFYECGGIEVVSFGKSIREISRSAFEGCSNIKSIMLPTSLKLICERAFANCSGLKEFKIPSSVEKIENEAFAGNRKMESVFAYTIEPIYIDQNTFSCWDYATLYVPKTSYYTYYLDKQWSQFMTVAEFDEPYEYFYLNDDYLLDDVTGRIDGVPDMLLNENSGIIVQGDEAQQINEIELVHNGTDGASIIGGDGDATGQVQNLTAKSMKVNIDVEGNRWYFFCFPFDVDLDSIECTSQYVFWRYDGNQRAQNGTGWAKLPDGTTALSKGIGYIFQTNRTGILTIHVGAEYLSFTSQTENEVLHTYASDDLSNASWNFIGNPFISYYDIRDLAEEYDAPIIVSNGRGGYDVYKPGEEDEEPYQLKPFEAFFVQKASGKQSINFRPDYRITYNQAKATNIQYASKRRVMGNVINPDRLLVNLTIMDKDSLTDRTRIVYSTNSSMDYEIGVDAPKFQSEGVPQLYTLAGGIRYSINERPAGNDEIKLGYVAPKAGVYTLSIPRTDADIEIYDNLLNSRVNFIDGRYDFDTKSGTYNDRFVIHKKSSSVTAIGKDILVDGLTLHPTNGGIDVVGNSVGQDIMVYLPTGALVAKLSADGFVNTGAGTFIVKVGDHSVKMVVE